MNEDRGERRVKSEEICIGSIGSKQGQQGVQSVDRASFPMATAQISQASNGRH